MQQAVFRAIDRKLIVLCEETVRPIQVLPQMRCHHQLAAKCKQVVLPAGIVAAQSTFDDVPDCAQKLSNEDF
ncbi:hypothetical protein D9M69_692620 [compost metagenome]